MEVELGCPALPSCCQGPSPEVGTQHSDRSTGPALPSCLSDRRVRAHGNSLIAAFGPTVREQSMWLRLPDPECGWGRGWGEMERRVTTKKRSLQPGKPGDQTGPTVQTAVQAHRLGWERAESAPPWALNTS